MNPSFLLMSAVWLLLFIAAWTDFKRYILPDWLLLPAGILAVAGRIVSEGAGSLPRILQGLIPAVFFVLFVLLAPVMLKKEGMGWGDVKLAAVLGIVAGLSRTLLAVGIASLSALVTLLILVRMGRKKITDPVPFGFYLVTAGFMTVLCVPGMVPHFLKF